MGNSLLEKSLAVTRETRQIEFKEIFDTNSKRDWCEIIKDIVAISNSGGGIILFGVNSRGQPVDVDLTAVKEIDPATIMDHLGPYIESQSIDIEVCEMEKSNYKLLGWIIKSSTTPVVFAKPGTFAIPGGKQSAAFGRGTVYFRHGAKSEPGTTEDIARALERRLESIRTEWLSGVRTVVHAPAGSRIGVLPTEVIQSTASDALAIRVTDDPTAPSYRVVSPDLTHPFRQKELIGAVRRQLPRGAGFNSFDVASIRHVYGIDEKPEFVHQPKFSSRQYSQEYVTWIVSKFRTDAGFLQKTRAQYKDR